MAKFYKDHLTHFDLSKDKSLIKISDCRELIKGTEFEETLLTFFEYEQVKDELVLIPGINKVIKSIILRDKQFKKMDLVSHISDISIVKKVDGNTITLQFNKAQPLGKNFIQANTVYSTKKDFFANIYKMDKFAKTWLAKGYFDLIKTNVDYLNKKFEDKENMFKNFRLLEDREGNFFVRGITSADVYKDYNIRFSVFATILSLQKILSKKDYSFIVNYCEYSESFIKIFFEKDTYQHIPNVGNLSFALEMSNDEIKRGAFKFSGLFTITSTKGEGKKIFLKPKKIKTPIISIQHRNSPETALENLSNLAEFIKNAEEEMSNDLLELSEVKNADELRFFLLRKIERSQKSELASFKKQIKERLDTKINKIDELITLMGTVDSMVTDLEAKEYIRYLFYEVLRHKK